MKFLLGLMTGAVSLCSPVVAPTVAQPLGTVFTYQGELKVSGAPAAGLHDLRFRLYDAAAGGAQIGPTLCSNNVSLTAGRFTVDLDFLAVFAGQQRFLEIDVRADTGLDCTNATGFTLLAPRQPLSAAPNALFALNAATAISATAATSATNAAQLNGQGAAFYLNAANLSSGTIPDARFAGTYSGVLSLSNAGNAFTGSGAGLTALNASNLSGGTVPGGRLSGLYTGSVTFGNSSNIFLGNGSGLTGLNAGNIVSGTLQDSRLTTNVALLDNTQTFTGVKTFSAAPSFAGAASPFSVTSTTRVTNLNADRLDGLDSTAFLQSIPVPLTLTSSNLHTIRADNTSTVWDSAGIIGTSTAATGLTYGGYFESASTLGRGVIGYVSAATGGTFGVYGESFSTQGRGVYGNASAATGVAVGGYFQSASTDGRGIVGESQAGTGETYGALGTSASTSGYGVFGVAQAATGTTYGVYGQSNSAAGWGVWAQGRSGASGTKSFRIDHPADPENKYLLHYCHEGPEPQNVYNGKVILDDRGEALVELPAYFASINREPRYTLTPIGAPMPMLHIADEVDDAKLATAAAAGPGEPIPAVAFRIAGGAPGAKVSWEVKAVRNDRWVQMRGADVEPDKPGRERGTYQHPELYGQPPEKGMNYSANRARREQARPEPDAACVP